MDHVGSVTERHTLDHLVDEEPQALRVNTHRVLLQDLEQIFLDVLKDQIQASLAVKFKIRDDGLLTV